MIDLILIQQGWESSAIIGRTFQGANTCSDYSLVLCNKRLRLRRMHNKMQHKTRIELSQLRVKECFGKKLASNIAIIEPAKKIEAAIKQPEEAIISASRSARKL